MESIYRFYLALWLVSALKVSVISDSGSTSSDCEFASLSQFLKAQTGQETQTWIGDTELALDISADVVVDCTTGLLRLNANSRAFSISSLYFYLEDERLRTPRAMRLKGDEGKSMVEAANLLARHFGLEEAVLITDSPLTVRNLSEVFVTLNVGKSIGRTEVKNLISRSVRSSGIKALFVIASSATADLILTALTELQMDEGYAIFLLGNDCQFTFTIYSTGVICVALAGSEAAKTSEEANYWYLLYGLGGKALDKFTVNDLFQGNLVTIGLIDQGTLTISPIVVFPRGLLTPPDTLPIKVKVNRCNWYSEDPAVMFRANDFTFKKLPLSNRKFSIETISLDDCSRIDPSTAYLPCYIASKTFKNTLLQSMVGDPLMLITALEFMKATNLRLPITETLLPLDNLSSTADYPNFTRLNQSISYLGVMTVLLLKYLKFYRILMFATSAYGPTFVDYINFTLAQVNIEQLAPSEIQELDYYNPDPDFFTKAALQISQSEIRPVMAFFFLTSDHIKFIEAIEAAEIGPEDIVIITSSIKTTDLLKNHPDKTDLILKYAPAYLTNDPNFFVGDLGAALEDTFFKLFGTKRSSDCYEYDQVKQTVLAIDFALRRGLNMYDWQEMEFAVRAVRFTGCSGVVTQSEEHNNRKDITMKTTHYQDNEEGVLEDVKVMEVALTGDRNYYPAAHVVWANGGTETPKVYWYTYKDCPFPEEYRQDSPKSSKRSAGIYFSFVGFSVAVALTVYFNHYRRVPMPLLAHPILLGTQDLLILACSFVDIFLLQLVSPGTLVNFVLVGMVSKKTWDRIDLSDGAYFSSSWLLYALLGVWLVATIVSVCRGFKPLSFDIQLFSSVFERSLSFLVFFALLTIFECNEAASRSSDEDFKDSFMDIDCHQYCWTGKHLAYSVASSLVLGAYLVVSIPMSYYLSNTLEGHQFRTSKFYALFRQPFLLAFIALHKSKPALSDAAYSAIFLVVLCLYILLCVKGQVFNIKNLTLWHNALLFAVLILSFTSTMNDLAYPNVVVWALLATALLIVLALICVYKLNRYPKMLLQPEKINIEALLNFAFRFNQMFTRSMLRVKEAANSEEAKTAN
jgi:hypothetical protein